VIADSDADKLRDAREFANNADPLLVDTDGDGLTDFEEIAGKLKSDPTLQDTDGDLWDDWTEVNSKPSNRSDGRE
jgi:hypothetical protein